MNRNLSDEKTAKVLQIMDTKYRLTDGTQDGIVSWINWQMEFGEEGTHWRWAGEPFNSSVQAIPADERPASAGGDPGGFVTNYPNYNPPEYFSTIQPASQADWTVNHLFGDRVKSMTFSTEFMDVFKRTNFDSLFERRGEALLTMAQEIFARAVIGEIDLDAEWDAYVEQFMRAGGNELMDEIAKMPRRADFFR